MNAENTTEKTEVREFPIRVQLIEPIDRRDKSGNVVDTISELVLSRRPKAKDMKGTQAGKLMMDDVIAMISRVCNQPTSVIDELSITDFNRIQEEINSFL